MSNLSQEKLDEIYQKLISAKSTPIGFDPKTTVPQFFFMTAQNKERPYGHATSLLEAEILMSHPVGDDSEQTTAYLDEKRKQLEDARTLLVSGQIGGFGALVSLVRAWGEDKGLTGANGKATVFGQFEKLEEEKEELRGALNDSNFEEIEDAIGDCTVVLILLAELAGTRFEKCLQGAYDIIKHRTGKMVGGVFQKDQ
jgi:NTP pyrophosphatase (non-canonical NTP hydrolase)